MLKNYARLLSFGVILFFLTSSAQALDNVNRTTTEFTPSANILPRVEFWKLIFTKYGEHDLVFHHRDHPQIIYSVISIASAARKLWPGQLEKHEEKTIRAQRKIISASLLHLAQGRSPRDDLEKRISKMFATIPGSSRKYSYAATDDQIRVQSGIKERFMQGLIRSGRYLPKMEQIFISEGLPIELARIPLIESSFDYEAYSSVGAAGIWQFMRSTGRSYMRIDASIDERRDPIIATRAAAKYLSHAFEVLRSWPLAVTSYNHGINGVLKASRSVGTKDLGTIINAYKSDLFGFASKNFYPEFLAALEIEQNTTKYFPQLQKEKLIEFDEVKIGKSIGFKDIVKFTGVDATTIKNLNLAFRPAIISNRAWINTGTVVKVPHGKGRELAAAIGKSELLTIYGGTKEFVARINKPTAFLTPGDRYTVQSGDTVSELASRFKVSSAQIMQLNKLKKPQALRAGMVIILPGGSPSTENNLSNDTPKNITSNKSKEKQAVITKKQANYRVKKGDTATAIARRFSVTTKDLLRLNSISNPKNLREGKLLIIP